MEQVQLLFCYRAFFHMARLDNDREGSQDQEYRYEGVHAPTQAPAFSEHSSQRTQHTTRASFVQRRKACNHE